MPLGIPGVAYCQQAKEIIWNVWRYFQRQEDENGASAVINTLAATGVKSKTTLYKIKRDGPLPPKKRGPKTKSVLKDVDWFDRTRIRAIISDMYQNKEWPTVKKIHEKAKQDINFKGSKATLKNLLKDMGYKYSKRPDRNLVKERPDIIAKKHEYILKIRKLRELTTRGCEFIYLDETFLNANHTVGKCWLSSDGDGGLLVPTGKGSRLIILHAGSSKGFVSNALLSFQSKSNSADYHDEMNGDVFADWFQHQLLPNIPPNSVIVMDNAPYHSVRKEKIPTMNSLKSEMQEWLTLHNISWDATMIKPQLYTLIKLHKPNHISYVIDELARAHGHYVLRLPPYYCELNPIELIWGIIKSDVAVTNTTFKISDVKTLLEAAISKMTPENWQKAEAHVVELEEEMFAKEIRMDSTISNDCLLASYRFSLDDDTSSDESSDDDDSAQEFLQSAEA